MKLNHSKSTKGTWWVAQFVLGEGLPDAGRNSAYATWNKSHLSNFSWEWHNLEWSWRKEMGLGVGWGKEQGEESRGRCIWSDPIFLVYINLTPNHWEELSPLRPWPPKEPNSLSMPRQVFSHSRKKSPSLPLPSESLHHTQPKERNFHTRRTCNHWQIKTGKFLLIMSLAWTSLFTSYNS